ncbi:SpoIIE family protein phosphatase [Hymenobacter busanensis]|uniref:SpoIIE family protein phosphatase n=1 Tax=Hymenobacter busanensis TaxID=2607656 RepID=A0A7L5A1X1_9BACT|nr:SpoIIE family protein phosphatase [Hymenobacter busanensis]KAA9338566.1 SpoIIE family protein phosphatase [Hymenobacter busanensis]QHJ09005.1 SpoIIE family protein phosphatase [Hymenobacter busanensis]
MTPFPRKLNSALLPGAALCWLAMLVGAVLRASPELAQQWGTVPDGALLGAHAGMTLFLFLHERNHLSRLRGTEFVALLRRLMMGAGLLAAAGAVVHFAAQALGLIPVASNTVPLNVLYVVNIGVTTFFLARAYNTWRSLVFFRATHTTRQRWYWFELLLGIALVLRLFIPGNALVYLAVPLLGLAILGVYLGSHQQWVAYISRKHRWAAVGLQLMALVVCVLLMVYFLSTQQDTTLVAPFGQRAFLLLMTAFSAFYSFVGLMVTFVTLPTATVFEQKREEILSMQRLAQFIQKGQSEQEVYSLLFDSAVQTVDADAAWLDLHEATANPALSHRIDATTSRRICDLLTDYNIGHIDYLNNDLPNSAGFRALNLPYGSLIVMPLRTSQSHVGTLYLLKHNTQGFDRENLGLLQTFTGQTVVRIENLRLMEESLHNELVKEELKIASLVQESLIPKVLPADSWFEIRWHSQAAREVGGDFYDFLQLSASRIAIIIGDVSGKGTTAAFHVAQLKGIFHTLMLLDQPEKGQPLQPSKFMTMANQALSHCLERSSFITASFYIIDYKERGFAFARAGHCHTLYYNAVTEETFYFQTAGLGLGILRDASYEKRIKNMYYDYNPGDVMVMYTDGIVEARDVNGEEYGEDRLRELLGRTFYLDAEEIKQAIVDDVEQFSHGLPPHDDQTLLIVKFKSTQPEVLA